MPANLIDFLLPGFGGPDRLAVMQHAALIMAVSADRQDLYEQALTVMGDERIKCLLWDWTSEQLRPAWAVYISGLDLVITIRGTTNGTQWYNHIVGGWGTEYLKDRGVYVHTAHRDVSVDLFKIVNDFLDAGIPWRRIFVAGHSYGASLAALVAIGIARKGYGNICQLCTFGSPRFMTHGLRELKVALPDVWYNIMGNDDFITRTPTPWMSSRILLKVANQVMMAILRVPAVVKRAAGQGFGQVIGIGNWTHYGTRAELTDDGLLLVQAEENPAFFQSPANWLPPEMEFATRHYMQSAYWPRLVQGFVSIDPRVVKLVQIGHQAAEAPTSRDPDTWWQEAAPAAAAEARRFLSPYPESIEPAEVIRAEVSSLTLSLVDARATTNIGDQRRASGASTVAWKYTAYISWGKLGRSISQHRQGPADFKSALADAYQWVFKYAKILGNSGSFPPLEGQFAVGTPGTPVIEYVRVSDALKPRISQRKRVPGDLGQGFRAATPTTSGGTKEGICSSDAPWVGFSYQLRSVTPDRVISDTITFLGMPDAAYQFGGYYPTALVGNGNAVQVYLTQYLAELLTPGGWGVMGRGPGVIDYPVTKFATNVDNRVQITVPGATWETNDVIRLKGTGVNYLNRKWGVILEPTGVYTLKGSAMAKPDLPSEGTGYLVKNASGVLQLTFFPYSDTFDDLDIPGEIKPTKRNPARAYNPLAGRRRRRTPPKKSTAPLTLAVSP